MIQTMPNIPQEYQSHIQANADWKQIVAWANDLPPLPHVATKAIALIETQEVRTPELTSLLSQDTALAAKVLKIANSAMFSRQREISTISQAIMLIGLKTLKGIIVAASLKSIQNKSGYIEKLIWENSTCTAVASQVICRKIKSSFIDESYITGLLHDLGKLVLSQSLKQEYAEIVENTKSKTTFIDAETKALGCSHSLIGALVAKKWNFSGETCQTILYHHEEIKNISEASLKHKVLIVQTANAIAHVLGYGHLEGYPDQTDALIKYWAILDLAPDSLEETKEEVQKLYSEQIAIIG